MCIDELIDHDDKKEVDKLLYENMIERYGVAVFDRAIPLIFDGLIEVYRRIIYCAYNEKFYDHGGPQGKKLHKSAQIVGAVIAKLHPHGDQSTYGALVELTQWFSTNYPYFYTESNFGNILGDSAASYRYTDCRGSDFLKDVVLDLISSESIDYVDNFDRTMLEPQILPSKLPLLLLNGIPSGIGLAFTSTIPPHNIEDVGNMCIKYIQNKNISNADLVEGVYPDYPTGGVVTNAKEVNDYYKNPSEDISVTVKMKALTEVNPEKNTIRIINLPYKTDYSQIADKIRNAIDPKSNKQNPIISKIVDHRSLKNPNATDVHNTDIIEITVSNDANIYEVEKELFKNCGLRKPLNLKLNVNYGNSIIKAVDFKEIIKRWYETRIQVYTRICTSKRNTKKIQQHKYEGLLFIYDRMDEIIKFIKEQESKKDIIEGLYSKFGLTRSQALSISEMQLYTLTKVSKKGLEERLEKTIKDIEEIDYQLDHMDELLIEEIKGLMSKYKRPRRTILQNSEDVKEKISISNGAILFSRSSVALCDVVYLYNVKNIINGMKVVKYNNKNVREIIGCVEIVDNLEAIVAIQENGDSRRYTIDQIEHKNTWIELVKDSNFIKAIVPIYSDFNTEVIIANKENKLKRCIINTEYTSNNKRNIGPINAIGSYKEGTINTILAMDENGSNVLLEDTKNDIPTASIKAGGVLTKFSKPITTLLPINTDFVLCNLSSIQDNTITNHSTIINDTTFFNSGHRGIKPKKKNENILESAVGCLDLINKKNSTLIVIENFNIRKNPLSKYKVNQLKNSSCKTIGVIQINEN